MPKTHVVAARERDDPDFAPKNPDEGPNTSPFPDPSHQPASDLDFGEQEIVNAMRWTLDRESRSRLAHEQNWTKTWELYNNRYSIFSQKAKWQSKRPMPKVFAGTHRTAAALSQPITTVDGNWFNLLSDSFIDQLWMDFSKNLIKESLDDPDVNFDSLFEQSIVVGCLAQQMPVMVTMTDAPTPTLRQPAGTSDTMGNFFFDALMGDSGFSSQPPTSPKKRQRTRLRLELVDPFRVYKDSMGRGRYLIRTFRYTRGEFKMEADRLGWKYQEEVLASAEMRNPTMEQPWVDMIEIRNRDNLTALNMDEKDYVHLQLQWGDIYDMRGELLAHDSFAILANGRWLVHGPVPLADAHGLFPLLAPTLIKVPFSPYGKSLIGVSVDSIELWTEFMNLMVDYFQKMALGMVEIDEHLIENDSNPRVTYPGKVFSRSPNADPSQPVVRPVSFQEPSVQLWQFLGSLQQEWNDGTAMSSGMSGQQRVRGRVSAMEMNKRAADGGAIINYVFKNLENNFLEKLLYMVFINLLQYMTQEEWDNAVTEYAARITGEAGEKIKELLGKSSDWRVQNLGFGIRFRVRVFSAIADKQAEIEKVTIIMNMLQKDPVALAHVKRWPLLRRLFEALGWDPEEFLESGPALPQDSLNPQMMIQWQQQLDQMLQQMKQMGVQGSNVIPGGAAGAGTPAAPPGNASPMGAPPGIPQTSTGDGQPPGQLGFGQQMPGTGNPMSNLFATIAAGAGGGNPQVANQGMPGSASPRGVTS